MGSICLIIVFYNPTLDQVERVKLLSQTKQIFIIDNSEEEIGLFEEIKNIDYIPLHINKGIAFAQNVGIRKALEQQFEYVVFLDQDSKLKDTDIDRLLSVFKRIAQSDSKAAAIGPVIINSDTGKEYKSRQRITRTFKVDSIISSGSLVKMSVFRDVGMMEDRLFIDLVDHEWCWRCGSYGYSIYMTHEVELNHKVGEKTKHFLGLQFIVSAPQRYYFKYRNALWLIKRDYVPTKWKFKTVLRIVVEYLVFLITGIFNNESKKRSQFALTGIKDGVKLYQ